MRQISQRCIDLVKQFEGCNLNAYRCPAGKITIGYGHTGTLDGYYLYMGAKITQEKAESLLRKDLATFADHVNKFDAHYHWNQNEFDALVSFAFNVGSINQLTANKTRTKAQIAQKMLLYDKAAGKVLLGLSRRRKAEQALFLEEVKPVTQPVQESNVQKLPIIINDEEYELDGVFEAGRNYFAVRDIARLLGAEVSNQGSVPVLKTNK